MNPRVVIVGAGSAGVAVAARLRRARDDLEIVIVSPETTHDYQPLWTLVGGGLADFGETRRELVDVLPPNVEWIADAVTELRPDDDCVVTRGGAIISYDALVVAPGLRIALEEVAGLRRALDEDPRVWTNYLPKYVTKGRAAIEAFAGGNALFTVPRSPMKCGGAPQKIMWIVDDALRRRRMRDAAQIKFVVPGDRIFGIAKYRQALEPIAEARGVELVAHRHLVEVRPHESLAIFEDPRDGSEHALPYALMHVTPPSRPPDFVVDSPLAAAGGRVDPAARTLAAVRRDLPQGGPGGFVQVDRHTLRHVRYENVFGLGDASDLPTAKTGAAVRKQAPVVAANLLATLAGRPMTARYDGYTSCPLVMDRHHVMLAEFRYDDEIAETFPFDQAKPRYSMWLLKRYVLPTLYWHGMLRGLA